MHAVLRYANGDRRIFQIPDELRGNNGELPPYVTLDDIAFVRVVGGGTQGLPVYAEDPTAKIFTR